MRVASANPPFIDAHAFTTDLVAVTFQLLLQTEDRHLGVHKEV